MPFISRTSCPLVDYADVMYDAITERNEELIREYASKRKKDHEVGNPFPYASPVLTPFSYRLTQIETRNAKRTWNDMLCSSYECSVAKRFSRESNLMESYYTSTEFANVVTPSHTCELALTVN